MIKRTIFALTIALFALLIPETVLADSYIEINIDGIIYTIKYDGYRESAVGISASARPVSNFSGVANFLSSVSGIIEWYDSGNTLHTKEVTAPVIRVGGFGCTGLTGVTIPNSVTDLDSFSGCTGLTEISIPNSITAIWPWTFNRCTGLTRVTIPSSLAIMSTDKYDGEPFGYCTNLKEIIWEAKNCHLYVGDEPLNLSMPHQNPFTGCESITHIVIGSEVEFIDVDMFDNYNASGGVLYESKLETVTSYAVNPPVLGGGCFPSYDAKLFVPSGSVEAYKNAPIWRLFFNIDSIDNPKTTFTWLGFEDSDILTMYVGQTLLFNFIVYGEDGGSEYVIPTYTVSEEGLLEIDGQYITAIAPGICYLTASYMDRTCEKQIIILPSNTSPSDVNGDGEITIADVNIVINCIHSGKFNPSSDVNDDGEITIADINAIINVILGVSH